jgi:hypothetical protein
MGCSFDESPHRSPGRELLVLRVAVTVRHPGDVVRESSEEFRTRKVALLDLGVDVLERHLAEESDAELVP